MYDCDSMKQALYLNTLLINDKTLDTFIIYC